MDLLLTSSLFLFSMLAFYGALSFARDTAYFIADWRKKK